MTVLGGFKADPGRHAMTIGEAFELLLGPDTPISFRAYDGSSAGRSDAPVRLRLKNPRGLAYVAGAPSSLGFARAYLMGDLDVEGVHPGDPYQLLRVAETLLNPRRPGPAGCWPVG